MNDYHKILYATIKTWELEERLRRDDFSFDAFEFLSKRIGHKNSSTLRKMCELRRGNGAKLGVEEAITIMGITGDYRLLHYMKECLKSLVREHREQLDLFSQPMRSLKDYLE